MKKIQKSIIANLGIFLVLFILFPMPAFAASSCTGTPGPLNIESNNTTVATVLNYGTCLIEKSVVPLMFAVATLVFLYGTIMFIKEDNTEKKEKGRQFMIWAIVGLAVMFSVWGLVGVLENTFGITNTIPQLPVATG